MNKGFLSLSSALCALSCAVALAAVPDGYVVKVDNNTVYLDWGKASGVQAGGRFSVYRPGEALKHPVTGEVLGKTEQALGSGALQSVDEKFSLGTLDSQTGVADGKINMNVPQAGDRCRWLGNASTAAAIVPAVVVETALAIIPNTLAEVWRSDPLEKDPVGLAFADLDGDGKKDIILAYGKMIQAYRWKDKHLEPLAKYEDRSYRHWLAVEAAAVKPGVPAEIFATNYIDGLNRPRVVVLHYENGALKKTAEFEGFARAAAHADGRRPLYWQNLSRSRVFSLTAVSEITWDKKEYRPGKPIDLKLFDDQLFGFVWGDWDKDGKEDFAVMEHGERVRIFTQDMKWKSDATYGGTKNDFSFDDDTRGNLTPRMFSWRPAGADRDQLIIPTNLPELGIRTTYLKFYKRSQIDGLSWNGQEMKPVWRVSIQGYLADFGIADVVGDPKPLLWVAASSPNDKTILISYTLP